jgi:hypothetical protein
MAVALVLPFVGMAVNIAYATDECFVFVGHAPDSVAALPAPTAASPISSLPSPTSAPSRQSRDRRSWTGVGG